MAGYFTKARLAVLQTMPHHHPCVTEGCRGLVECDGDPSPNYDGWPATACDGYHWPEGVINPHALCDACVERRRA